MSKSSVFVRVNSNAVLLEVEEKEFNGINGKFACTPKGYAFDLPFDFPEDKDKKRYYPMFCIPENVNDLTSEYIGYCKIDKIDKSKAYGQEDKVIVKKNLFFHEDIKAIP